MNWNQCFARRTGQMKRSAVREILKVTSRPDIISFAGGLPASDLFPVPKVQAAVEAVFKRVGGQSLQYAETEGVAGLREWIARKLSRPHLAVSAENVLVTSGAQQALDLIGRVMLDAGDRVLVENPTYLALLSAWRPLGVEFVSAASDPSGMRLDGLDELALKKHPKVLYLVPNFQNPQGTTLSRDRREELVAWLKINNVAAVEDDPYGQLRYDGEPLPSLFELDATVKPGAGLESRVIRVGSFSKILMPGLRVGWVAAAQPVIEKLVQAKQAADLHTSSLSQYIVWELVQNGFLEEFVPLLCSTYRQRRDVMIASLQRHFSGFATWTQPQGGMFLMVTLARDIDATQLLPQALEQKVAFVPGEEFHLNGEGRHTMRLNFSNSRPEAIESGIARLAAVVKRNH
jgi:2-aminoadipate transaminase